MTYPQIICNLFFAERANFDTAQSILAFFLSLWEVSFIITYFDYNSYKPLYPPCPEYNPQGHLIAQKMIAKINRLLTNY